MRSFPHFLLATSLGLGALVAPEVALSDEDLSLATGEEQAIELNDLAQNVNIGRPGVVTVDKAGSKKTLVIRGRTAGAKKG